jgi:thiamine-phosphate pyrophosphorylase
LREIRHKIHQIAPPHSLLIKARDVERDVGTGFGFKKKEGSYEVLRKNLVRAQEAMRVLEEFSGEKEISALRYELYSIEKQLLTRPLISGLYLIIDTSLCDPVVATKEAVSAGAKIVQIRAKGMEDGEFAQIAQEIRGISKEITFIVNDRADIATAVSADGVHLGQADIPISLARKVFSGIVGISCHSLDEAEKAANEGADYIGIGPIFSTTTKIGVSPIGPEMVRRVKEKVRIPVVAVGGIDLDNIDAVRCADAVAVASGILRKREMKKAVSAYLEKLL